MVVQTRDKLRAGAAKLHALLRQFELLLDGEGTAELDRTQRRINRAVADQSRLVTELLVASASASASAMPKGGAATREGTRFGLAGQPPMREQVLNALDRIGVPATPREAAEVAFALTGTELVPGRFASLRRDEYRAYTNDPRSRPSYVVPAINAAGLTAMARVVADSAWEPERRLIGTRTLRANHLRTLLALLDMRAGAEEREDATAMKRLGLLIGRYAESVPGAAEHGQELDLGRVREATAAELARIGVVDEEERAAAALRLEKLREDRQLWGLPAVAETEGADRRRLG
jgi:hypothetical protein